MPLPGYGLLVGKPVASRPQRHGHAHWLAMVNPGLPGHPPYRVGVNLESTAADGSPELQYQIVGVASDGTSPLKSLADKLRTNGTTPSFLTGPDQPALDYVRGGLLDPSAFQTVGTGANPLKAAFDAELAAAIAANGDTLLAVFGTGYPIKPGTTRSPTTGFTGIENIHMNQGTPNRIGVGSQYRENGANQDGGLIFLKADGSATAFFIKFVVQSLDTDANGNPRLSGHPAIDDHLETAKTTLTTSPAVKAALSTPQPPAANPNGFVFADPKDDATSTFEPDVDKAFNTPFVQTIAKGHARTDVPDPRLGMNVFLALTDIVGPGIPGHKVAAGVETLQFDMIGDSGAVTAAKLKGSMAVGDLMTDMALTSPPAFCYHVGDVVYYYGEKQFYYGQFAEVFKDYPAPIFAIPGNHDALTYEQSQIPLQSFRDAFCTEKAAPWDGFGGVQRSTMTQPGVFFTLDAPLVSIIGLYSNAAESGGWLNDKQYAFLLGELTRLRADRVAKNKAIVLAIHHLPKWFLNDPTSVALDAIFQKAGVWPDAVVVGHAHLYQRIVRQQGEEKAPANIPYFVNGGGGYGIVATQKSGGRYLTTLEPAMQAFVPEEGFLRVTAQKDATALTLRFDYHSVKHALTDPPSDTYTVTI